MGLFFTIMLIAKHSMLNGISLFIFGWETIDLPPVGGGIWLDVAQR
jgi:hypothetical protein